MTAHPQSTSQSLSRDSARWLPKSSGPARSDSCSAHRYIHFQSSSPCFSPVSESAAHRFVALPNSLEPARGAGSCQLLGAGAIAWTAYNARSGASLLAGQPVPVLQHLVQFSARSRPRILDVVTADTPMGRQLSARTCRKRAAQIRHRQVIAGVYAANTLGAIVGALGASLVLIAWMGSQHTEQVLIAVSVLAGLFFLLPGVAAGPRRSGGSRGIARCLLISSVPPVSKLLIAYGRYAATWVGKSDIVYAREGMNSSVAVSEFSNGTRTFHVAGKIQASTCRPRHATAADAGPPHHSGSRQSSLRPGYRLRCRNYGRRSVHRSEKWNTMTIVEIEPLVPQAASTYFASRISDVLSNPKVQSAYRRRPALSPDDEAKSSMRSPPIRWTHG